MLYNMNKLIEAIGYASDAYWGDPERFKFMAMIDSFSNQNRIVCG
jgi:undecaprenyl pyrophosphate synthase